MQNHKTDTRMEDVLKPAETIQEVSQEEGQSGCPECQEEIGRVYIDQYPAAQYFETTEQASKQIEKVRYRYDRRIGGWRRTY